MESKALVDDSSYDFNINDEHFKDFIPTRPFIYTLF